MVVLIRNFLGWNSLYLIFSPSSPLPRLCCHNPDLSRYTKFSSLMMFIYSFQHYMPCTCCLITHFQTIAESDYIHHGGYKLFV